MPGGDGTGPAGLGPKTGRAVGYCTGYPVPGYMHPVSGYPAPGHFSVGRGSWSFGRGRGRRNLYWATGRHGWFRYPFGDPVLGRTGNPYPPHLFTPIEMTPEQEIEMLKDNAAQMQNDFKAIEERIKELQEQGAQLNEKPNKG